MKPESISTIVKRVASSEHPTKWIERKRSAYALALAIVVGLGVVVTPSARAQTFKVLHAFAGADGQEPLAGLILANGTLYGTTVSGGAHGSGAVFKLDNQNKETVLYSFADLGDGANPYGRLVRDAAGNLYGTTYINGSKGGGVVFKLSGKTETVLHNFGAGSDGSGPTAGLVMDSTGNLYGTTSKGGTGHCSGGCGTVFKVTKAGKETVLYNFKAGTDGYEPLAGLVRDGAGNLYGTTYGGGAGYGTVFKVTSAGKETVLHSFNFSDGANPYGGLVRDAKGNLYGTTTIGGIGAGNVFKLDARGKETVLYNFTGGADGWHPEAGLILYTNGNLYGTTVEGGNPQVSAGVVFEVHATGGETVLHSFTVTDGRNPVADLVRDAAGNLYGTTKLGGAGNRGVVFKLTP